MGNNYRPVMPLNGRKIQFSGAQKGEKEEMVVLGARTVRERQGKAREESWEAGLVPGWAVVLISLAVALNVGLAVWLVMRRRSDKYREHNILPTEEQ